MVLGFITAAYDRDPSNLHLAQNVFDAVIHHLG